MTPVAFPYKKVHDLLMIKHIEWAFDFACIIYFQRNKRSVNIMACNLFLRLIKHQDYAHSTVHLPSPFTFKLCVEVAALCVSHKLKRDLWVGRFLLPWHWLFGGKASNFPKGNTGTPCRVTLCVSVLPFIHLPSILSHLHPQRHERC